LDAKVNWKGGLSFNGTADSGFTLPLGASPVVGGADDGAISLAGCTGMDVISILQKKREQVTGFDVQVHAERAEKHPKVFTSVAVDFHVSGHNISEDALLRSIELSAEIMPCCGLSNCQQKSTVRRRACSSKLCRLKSGITSTKNGGMESGLLSKVGLMSLPILELKLVIE
jgi:putative redox protein